jgi:protein-tyrosine phosphatase
MFVYRAIMEVAQFGDTEIESSKLKATWTEFVSESGHKKLEEEFSRLSCIVDDRKALSVGKQSISRTFFHGKQGFKVKSYLQGTNEENRSKNQSELIIPYDRNRVILTPDGMKPHSTYINASFIEGYNNDESFIITQVISK